MPPVPGAHVHEVHHGARVSDAHRRAVETTFADIVKALQEAFGTGLVAHLAGGVERKTVVRWAEGGKPRSEAEARVRLAFHVMQLLLSRDSEHTVRAWFIGLNPQLDDTAPAQALHDGQLREVLVAAKSFTLGG